MDIYSVSYSTRERITPRTSHPRENHTERASQQHTIIPIQTRPETDSPRNRITATHKTRDVIPPRQRDIRRETESHRERITLIEDHTERESTRNKITLIQNHFETESPRDRITPIWNHLDTESPERKTAESAIARSLKQNHPEASDFSKSERSILLITFN